VRAVVVMHPPFGEGESVFLQTKFGSQGGLRGLKC
jgi:hypothetical protein